MKHNILIYRHQLFKPSEVFILQQAESLKEFNPIYVGRQVFGNYKEGTKVVTLEDENKLDVMKNILFRNPIPYVKKVKRFNPTLIHAHFGVEGVYAMELAKALKIPLVTTFHGFDATTSTKNLLLSRKPSWINYALFRKQLAKRGDIFICVSNYIRERVVKMGFPEDRTITHYIGIDTDKFKPIKENTKVPYILHVARLVENKGTKYLIEAFSYVTKKNKEVELVIIGDGPLRTELEALSKSLNIENKVHFMGAQPHSVVMEWMKKAKIFCLPSVTARSGATEGLGMVFLEAAALGVPSVATNLGGIPEAVIDGETGYLVPERAVDELAERLNYLLENETLRDKMGKAARIMVERRFNLQCQTQKLEEIYKSLL
ncbi:glycosyltransferase [Thermoanaerobacter sp. X514]|uniref:glycosyltransferase n=1 Tax=Thermoanaerobacter sp. (strain X514) TaxID=399726 RepID=UPI0000E1E042|nr:glycosyltransferase [Thermoanaerobacter sp. X514]ABY93548.1 glycosyl transferase, group 1 [Thermoanaerobacter sp. X514]